jgi:hypothetical protein
MPGRQLHELFLLNLALQLFDGVATLQGHACWNEGNPLIRSTMQILGVEHTLLLFKAQACGCLVLLRRSGAPGLAALGFRIGATFYLGLSFVPWMARFLSLAWA